MYWLRYVLCIILIVGLVILIKKNNIIKNKKIMTALIVAFSIIFVAVAISTFIFVTMGANHQ